MTFCLTFGKTYVIPIENQVGKGLNIAGINEDSIGLH